METGFNPSPCAWLLRPVVRVGGRRRSDTHTHTHAGRDTHRSTPHLIKAPPFDKCLNTRYLGQTGADNFDRDTKQGKRHKRKGKTKGEGRKWGHRERDMAAMKIKTWRYDKSHIPLWRASWRCRHTHGHTHTRAHTQAHRHSTDTRHHCTSTDTRHH